MLLIQIQQPLSKKEIAVKLDRSEHTVAKALAELSRASYIKVSKGNYVITPKGKAAPELDPNLTDFISDTPTESGITLKLDWEYISKSVICSAVLQPDNLNGLPSAEDFLPFVLIYLRLTKQRLPVIERCTSGTYRDEVVYHAMVDFFKTVKRFDQDEDDRVAAERQVANG